MKTVLDSNIVLYYLNAALDKKVRQFVDQTVLEGTSISIITRIEVLGFQGHTDNKYKVAKELLNQFAEYSLNNDIVKKTISLRRQYSIKIPDAIIAATALNIGFSLITRNVKDFKKIKDLKIINPFD
ncbi:MAG: type II toxin-antitoxin system VapC family toxin [bacterium]